VAPPRAATRVAPTTPSYPLTDATVLRAATTLLVCDSERRFHELWLTTVHENDGVVPLLDKEGPAVVDCWATTPNPLLLRRRGAIFMAVAHARPLTGTQKP